MKKSLLAIGAVLATSISFGQITIDEWDLVGPGDEITQNTDTLPSIAFPAAGTNMTWDMSALNNHTQIVINFVAPGELNNASSFPNSNIAGLNPDGFEVYFEKDATGLRNVGIAGDFFGTGDKQIHINPADELIRFPANYNDSYTTTTSQYFSVLGSEVGSPLDSIVSISSTDKTVDIDGWGSVTTPYGTFEALRMNEMSIKTDSSWAYSFGIQTLVNNSIDTSYSLVFWSNNPGTKFPLVELDLDSGGNVLSVEWLAGATVASLEENTPNASSVYPNPASNEVNVNLDGPTNATFVMYDLNGKEVMSTVVSNTSAVNVSGINEGLYVYKVISNNTELKTGKITIKH